MVRSSIVVFALVVFALVVMWSLRFWRAPRLPFRFGDAFRSPPARGARCPRGSALLQADLLVGRGHVEKRVEPDGGLLHARAYPVERRRLEDRRVHDAL